jgi:hypothetical protein
MQHHQIDSASSALGPRSLEIRKLGSRGGGEKDGEKTNNPSHRKQINDHELILTFELTGPLVECFEASGSPLMLWMAQLERTGSKMASGNGIAITFAVDHRKAPVNRNMGPFSVGRQQAS